MYKMILASILSVACLSVAGCFSAVGEAVNPYKSGFNCPMEDKGKCISVPNAYKEALQPIAPHPDGNVSDKPEATYQESLYKKLGRLIDDPTTPAIAPPKVMRALFLPYKIADRELYMYRYVFFLVDDYAWVLGDNGPVGDK